VINIRDRDRLLAKASLIDMGEIREEYLVNEVAYYIAKARTEGANEMLDLIRASL
jgi:hypothetical protein